MYEAKPIVCRFKNFKDREVVRKAAQELKGTRYGVSEQFPKEINDRRGLVFKKLDAKTTKAYFKRDRLYIEGNEFIHRSNITQETANRDSQQRRQYTARPREKVSGSFNGRRNEGTSGNDKRIQSTKIGEPWRDI